MDLLNPDFGLVIWMLISFLGLVIILRKFAWKPILTAIKSREESISKALDAAKDAESRLGSLKAENEALLAEARRERDQILREARDAKDRIIAEAQEKASAEGTKMIAAARESIENEKMKALTELRNNVATFSIEIAEKILRQQMSDDAKQQEVVNRILKEVNLN